MMSTEIDDDLGSFELFTCQVCFENMLDRHPRTLTCNHTYCQSCLSRLVNNNTLICPTCRSKTAVPDNNVEKLPINFNLNIMKEREKELVLNTDILCQPCFANDVRSKATVKCNECMRVMCDSCRDVHNKVPVYRGHTVEMLTVPKSSSEVCARHKQKVTMLCHMCVKGLCVDCMFSPDHRGHQDQIEDFTIGITNAKFKLDEQKTDLKHEISKLEKRLAHAKQNRNSIQNTSKEYETKKKTYQGKIEEANEFLNDMKNNYEKPTEEAIMNLSNVLIIAQTALESLNPLESLADFVFLNKLNLVKDKIDRTIKTARESLNVRYPSLKYTPAEAPTKIEQTIPPLPPKPKTSPIKLQNYEAKLLSTVSKADGTPLGRPAELVGLEDGSVLVVDIRRNVVLRFDTAGELLCRYYPKIDGIIRSICVYKDMLYIAGERNITKVPMAHSPQGTSTKSQHWELDVKCIGKIAAVDDETLIITEISAGRIMEFNTKTNKTCVKVRDLDQPDFISVDQSKMNYIISVYGKQSVIVYNKQWQQTKIIRGLKVPSATVSTGEEEILVADRHNHKVGLYSSWSLKGYILDGEKHRVSYPTGLAYCFPYLWVSQYSSPALLKCFQLKKI